MNLRLLARLAFTLAVVLACFVRPAASAPADNAVVLNFVNAEIDAVIKAVSEITGRNFVVDPRVKGVVNIISARPVPRSLVYPTLLAALRMQGFAAVESEGFVKIVPETDARQQGSPLLAPGSAAASGDRLVTQVYPLQYESAVQMVAVLRPLISPNNTVAALPTSNALVITDYAENLRRIDRVVSSLDQPPSAEPVIIPLRNASALDVAPMLSRLLVDAPATPGTADAMQRTAIVVEPRSNSLIVRADNRARMERIRALVEQLDTPARSGSNIRIVYLRNADAVRVAQTLRAVLTGSDAGAAATPAPPGGAALGMAGMTTAGLPLGAPATQPAAAGAFGTATAPGGGAGTAAASTIVAGGATIQADPTNNALVIAAPEPVYNNLREVIEKLDVRRAQVYVEALVAEVTAERAAEFGVQWQFLDAPSTANNYEGSGRGAGGTNFGQRGGGANILDAMTNLGAVGRGLNVGVLRGTVKLPGIGEIANLGVLVRALEGDANANILSMPNLLTLDNELAQVVIGQNIPIVTGSYAQGGANPGAVNPFQTFERRDVGLTLRVRPQITEGGAVKMQIYQEVSSVSDPSTLLSPGGVVTSKRALESTVLVDDGQVIVLGGLLQDSLTDGADKVPVVGDLPLIGQLFRYDSRRRAKTNLMVFLRPRVLRSPSATQAVSIDRYDYLINEQRRAVPADRFFWRDETAPQLPSLGGAPAPAPSPATLYPLPPASAVPSSPSGAASPAVGAPAPAR